jgi:hypothetical protein
MWWASRDLNRAQELVEEAGLLIERAESPNWLAHSYELRALVAYLQGDLERTHTLLSNASPIYLQIGNRGCSTHCLESAAAVVAGERPDATAELLGTAEQMREYLRVAPPPYERIVRERGIGSVRAALKPQIAERAWQRGRELGFEDAMARAHALLRRPALALSTDLCGVVPPLRVGGP